MPAIRETTGYDFQTGANDSFSDPTRPSWIGLDDRGEGQDYRRQSLNLDEAARHLTRTGLSWAPALGAATTVTFGFRSTAPSTMPDGAGGFTPFTQAQITATLLALQAWADVTNIVFVRLDGAGGYSNAATMLFGNYQTGVEGAAAFAYLPGSTATDSSSGDVWINRSLGPNVSPSTFSYGQLSLVHEIGHAIGLSHPSVYNGRASSFTYGANADYTEDSRQYTVMSYFSETGTQAQFNGLHPAAPMLDDIAAAQRLYGANMATRTGDTVYGFNSNADRPWFAATLGGLNEQTPSPLVFAVWDAGGIDTFDFGLYSQNQVIDLRQGSFSDVGGLTGNVAIALGTVIENARGGRGSDRIFGNSVDNLLTGGLGSDFIDGGLGQDTAIFTGRRSEYTITTYGQTVVVSHPVDGYDEITNVEFLRFSDTTLSVGATGDVVTTGGVTVAGDATNDVINGWALGDILRGSGGDDTINGLAGDDTLRGDSGNDTLNGGDGRDLADYSLNAGRVTVNLMAGTAIGRGEQDALISIENVRGTSFEDLLIGDGNDNTLYGNGGGDVMRGGGGNDSFYSGSSGAVWTETDIVKAQSLSNHDRASAVSMDSAFNRATRQDISGSANNPHATVNAISGGVAEWYAFTATANAAVMIDIDFASFDSVVRVYDAAGVLLASNDDGSSAGTDGDVGNDTDSALGFTAPSNGIYYVEVSAFAGSGPDLATQNPPAGGTYTLHVTVPGHPAPYTLVGNLLYGEDGDDIFYQGPSGDTANWGGGDDRIDGGSGTDSVAYSGHYSGFEVTMTNGVTTVRSIGAGSGSTGIDTLTGIEFLQFGLQRVALTPAGPMMLGGPGLAQMNGSDRDDLMQGYAGVDYMYGAGGNDRMNGGAGNDTLIGGTGIDTAVYSGLRRQYTASSTSISGNGEGTDTLISVESATFVDGVLSFDADSAYAQVARLFDAVLDRLPDQAGLEFQANALLTGGLTLLQLTDNFIQSAEFQARFGGLSNAAFIDNLFRFSLGRPGDAAGIQAWVDVLDAGASRASVVMSFSESPEHRQQLASIVNAGLWIPDVEALMIARLYDAAFERLPDAAGLASWLGLLDAGAPLLQIAAAFAGSPEFVLTYGALNNQQFVEQIYRACLNREGDVAGVEAWTNVLNQGASRAQVLVSFSESPEHVAVTAPLWSGGIRYPGYVGAPVDEVALKGLEDALVLPGHIGDQVYDPTDLGVTLATKVNDAFVLPADPDGGVVPWVLADDGAVAMLDLEFVLPLDGGGLALVIPALLTDEPGCLFHRDGLDLAWA